VTPATSPDAPPAGGAARWPAWLAPAAFVLALGLIFCASGVIAVVRRALGEGAAASPAATIAGTVVQDVAWLVAALLLVVQLGRPALADFGLSRLPARRALAGVILAGAGFYGVSAAYGALVGGGGGQDVLESLGADRGTGYFVATAVLVIVLAPVCEELFFRGFMYRALRNRLRPLPAAGVIGLVFGSLHFTGSGTLVLIPVLVLLGVTFCLLYERTGSLVPAICLHVVNNTVALAAADEVDAAPLALAIGAAMLATCLLVGRQLPARAAVVTSRS
jgi:membrane protease YdiL (CAAX protease family)